MSHGAKFHKNPRFSFGNYFHDLENVSVKSKCEQDTQRQILPSANTENHHPFSNQQWRPKDIVVSDQASAETVFVEDTTMVEVHQA